MEQLLLAHSPRLRAILEASRKQIQEGQGLSHDAVWGESAAPPEPSDADEKPTPRPARKGKKTKRKKAG